MFVIESVKTGKALEKIFTKQTLINLLILNRLITLFTIYFSQIQFLIYHIF